MQLSELLFVSFLFSVSCGLIDDRSEQIDFNKLWSWLLTIATNGQCFDTNLDKEHVTVHLMSSDGVQRGRRSADIEFPSQLVFRFEMQTAGNVTLKLLRSVHPKTTTAIYTIDSDNVRLRNYATQHEFGVYQDVTLGASVLVKCPPSSTDHYEIFGSFIYESNHYQIEPILPFYRKRRSSKEDTSGEMHHGIFTHRIKRQSNTYGDFLGDELLPPPDSSGLNRVYDIPPYPGTADIPADDDTVPIIQLQMFKPHDRIFDTTTELYDSDVLLPSRRRRQSTETLYIEYMVVIDYKNLERWKAKVGGASVQVTVDNAFDAMHEYYQFIVNGIDVRFRTATGDGPEIRVNFATLLVSTEEKTSPWIQNNMLSSNSIDDAGVLLDFATWRNSAIQYLPSHDHAGLFTGFDLATPTSLNPIGMGYLNSICHKSWAVSEVEETYNAVAIHIAAHELGHNIGTRHDGNGNGCPSSSLYLMAPRLPFIYNANLRTNPWTFSTCSQNSINTYLAGLGSDNCLTNVPSRSSLNEEMPGLEYTADQQCNMTYGSDAVLCRDDLYYQWNSICYAMQCKKKGDNTCSGRFFPFDGTPCGDKKWCKSGECIPSVDAPSYSDTCLFGNDPNVDCSRSHACDESDLYSSKVRCCATCSQTTTSSSSTSSASTLSTTTSTIASTTPSTSTPSTTQSSTSSNMIPSTTTSSTTHSTTSTSITHSTTSSSKTPSVTTPITASSTSNTTPFTSTPSTISPPTPCTTSSTSITSGTTSTTSNTPSPSSPTSTSGPTTTSTTSTTSTTKPTPSQTEPITKDPRTELSFELQTMISIFITSALII